MTTLASLFDQEYGLVMPHNIPPKMTRHIGMLLVLILLVGGCRQTRNKMVRSAAIESAKIGILVAGNLTEDADTKKRFTMLQGKGLEAADMMFGFPIETLEKEGDPTRMIIVYPASMQQGEKTRYSVELSNGIIVGLAKGVVNKKASQQYKVDDPDKQVIGKIPRQIEQILGIPILKYRNIATDTRVRVYRAPNWANWSGRFLILRFDESEICTDVRVVKATGTG